MGTPVTEEYIGTMKRWAKISTMELHTDPEDIGLGTRTEIWKLGMALSWLWFQIAA